MHSIFRPRILRLAFRKTFMQIKHKMKEDNKNGNIINIYSTKKR